ncbi:hypothetical protein [Nonomuraea sp. NPDC050202]|uniref:hypothetical protein n=1 Tax=Nonomuraea sp. NPDC050202 TaxID=3155035 RepID=UPI003406D658
MEVLASLLPGIRDLRTPLTVGYLWLICGWLWFRDVLPQRATARGPIADLYDLDGILPSGTYLAALTFIAYFLGSIVELDIAAARWLDQVRPNRSAWEAVADRFRIRLDDTEGVTPERYTAAVAAWQRATPARTTKRVTLRANVTTDKARLELGDRDDGLAQIRAEQARIRAEADARGLGLPLPEKSRIVHQHETWTHESRVDGVWRRMHRSGSPTGGALVEWRGPQLPVAHDTVTGLPALAIAALYSLWDELPDLATRLLVERPEVFDRYDRLLAEASLRINMFLPLAALVGTLALRVHWLWWFGLVACAALLYQGFVQRSRALAVVLDSVAIRLIESPTMVAVAAAQHGETDSDPTAAASRAN